jgi:hypothetical protein
MSEISRRSFLKQGGASAAAAGALVAVPKSLSRRSKEAEPAKLTARTTRSAVKAKADHHLVVHVPDTGKGELRVMVGDREIVIHDREIVARLARAAG